MARIAPHLATWLRDIAQTDNIVATSLKFIDDGVDPVVALALTACHLAEWKRTWSPMVVFALARQPAGPIHLTSTGQDLAATMVNSILRDWRMIGAKATPGMLRRLRMELGDATFRKLAVATVRVLGDDRHPDSAYRTPYGFCALCGAEIAMLTAPLGAGLGFPEGDILHVCSYCSDCASALRETPA